MKIMILRKLLKAIIPTIIKCKTSYKSPDQWECSGGLWTQLTYDSIGLRSKCAHARGAWGHLELGEAPLGAEVFGKKAGRSQTAEREKRGGLGDTSFEE